MFFFVVVFLCLIVNAHRGYRANFCYIQLVTVSLRRNTSNLKLVSIENSNGQKSS